MRAWIKPLWALVVLAVPSTAVASLESADHAYRLRSNEDQARTALAEYRKIFDENPKDADAAWRVAMASYFVGLRMTSDPKARTDLFAQGREAGVASIALRPSDCAACYFWTAINMALYGQEIGPFKMLFSLKTIEEYLTHSIQIDPTYASGGAYRLLGVIRQKLPGVLGGSNRKAKEFFSRAIDVAPDEPLNYLFLARLLKDEFNDSEGAVDAVQRGLKVGALPADRVESIEARADLQKFLQKPEHE